KHRPLAVDPLGLDGIEPGAFTRQPAGDKADALPLRLDPMIMGVDPVAHLDAFMPRGIVPDQEQRLLAQRREFVAAPGQKLRGGSTDGLPYRKAQPDLFWGSRRGPQQQAITGQGFGRIIALGPRLLDQPQPSSGWCPAVQLGLRQATPPDLIRK